MFCIVLVVVFNISGCKKAEKKNEPDVEVMNNTDNLNIDVKLPLIILRSPKGWTGPKYVDGKKVEGSFRSHQVPLVVDSSHPELMSELENKIKGRLTINIKILKRNFPFLFVVSIMFFISSIE